jgi:transcriptional regulator with XRE-family HTH domain
MKKRQVKLSDAIRAAVDDSGMGRNAIGRALNIDKGLVSRFMSGKSGLSVANLDALADVLNLRIVADKPKRKGR